MPQSIAEMAKKIKTQHPEYASLDDKELVSKVITKYPQYADTLNPADVLQLSPSTYAIQRSRAAAQAPIDAAPKDPRRQATRNIAKAQPGITTATRAADPVNQGVTTGLRYAPAVAGALAAGPEIVMNPLPTLGKLISSGVSGAVGAGVGRYGAQKLGAGQDVQDLAEATGGLIGGIAGYREPPARYGFKGVGVNIPSSLRPVGAAAEAEVAAKLAAPASETVKAPASQSEAAPPTTVPEASSVPDSKGEAWSMQRKVSPELQQAAAAGDPGAIKVMQRLNPDWKPVVIPKEASSSIPSRGSSLLDRLREPEPANAAAARTKPATGNSVAMKMMITQADEANLRNLGYSQESINNMKPAEAGDILSKKTAAPPRKPIEGVTGSITEKPTFGRGEGGNAPPSEGMRAEAEKIAGKKLTSDEEVNNILTKRAMIPQPDVVDANVAAAKGRAQAAARIPPEAHVKLTGTGAERVGELGGRKYPIPENMTESEARSHVVQKHTNEILAELNAKRGAR